MRHVQSQLPNQGSNPYHPTPPSTSVEVKVPAVGPPGKSLNGFLSLEIKRSLKKAPPSQNGSHCPKQRRGSRGFEWQDQLSIPITFCCSSWDPAAFKLHVDQGSVGYGALSSLNTSNYIMPTTKPHIFKQDMYPRIQAHRGPSSRSAGRGWDRLWHFPCSGDPRRLSAIQCYLHSRFDTCLSDVFFSWLF